MRNDVSIKQNGLKSNLFFSVILKLLMYMIPLITAPYISRVLGPEGVGEYSFANSIVSYFALIVNFGFVGYGTLRISANRYDKTKYSAYFWSIIFVRFVLLLVSVSLYFLLLKIGIKNTESIEIYFILSLTIFANFFDITYLFQGLENFKIISVINSFVRLIGAVSLFVFVKKPEDLVLYAFIQTSQLIIVAALPWIFTRGSIEKPSFSISLIGDTVKTSFFFFLPTLAVTLCSLVDKTMLGTMSEKIQVGYYEQADKIILIVVNVLHAFAPVFSSRISLLVKQKKEVEIQNNINKMFELYFLIGIPSVLGLYAVSSRFIPLFFGDSFAPAVSVIIFLIPLILVLSGSNAIGNVYYGPRNLIWMTSIFYGIGSIVNIAINYCLIPQFGAKGAALASLISESLNLSLFIFYSRKGIDYRDIIKRSFKPFLAAIFMFVIIKGFEGFYVSIANGKGILVCIFEIAVGVITYGICLILLREPLVRQELYKMKNKIKSKLRID